MCAQPIKIYKAHKPFKIPIPPTLRLSSLPLQPMCRHIFALKWIGNSNLIVTWMMIRSTCILQQQAPDHFINKFKYFSSFLLHYSVPPSSPIEETGEDSASHLLSLLSLPNWQKNPRLKTLIPSISPSHITSLFNDNPNLKPQTALSFFNILSQRSNFRPSVESFASLLTILIKNRFLNVAEKIRISMVKACETDDGARFVLGFLVNPFPGTIAVDG